jgi:hypothetical protein
LYLYMPLAVAGSAEQDPEMTAMVAKSASKRGTFLPTPLDLK